MLLVHLCRRPRLPLTPLIVSSSSSKILVSSETERDRQAERAIVLLRYWFLRCLIAMPENQIVRYKSGKHSFEGERGVCHQLRFLFGSVTSFQDYCP